MSALLLSGCATARPTLADGAAFAAAYGLTALDTAQSIRMQSVLGNWRPSPTGAVLVDGGHRFAERDPLVVALFGRHPSAGEFIGLNLAADALTLAVWWVLPERWRLAAPLSVAGVEAVNDYRNWRAMR